VAIPGEGAGGWGQIFEWIAAKGGPFVSDAYQRTAVVCDRHLLWIEAVESVLERAEIGVVGRATTTEAALDAVLRSRPSMLVTDSVVAGDDDIDGVVLIERAREALPELRAIVVSMSDQRATIERAFSAMSTENGADATTSCPSSMCIESPTKSTPSSQYAYDPGVWPGIGIDTTPVAASSIVPLIPSVTVTGSTGQIFIKRRTMKLGLSPRAAASSTSAAPA